MADSPHLDPLAARALRQRLLLSLGLGALGLPGCLWPFKGGCEDSTYVTTVSLDALSGDTGADTGEDTGEDTGAGSALEDCPTDPAEVEALLDAAGEGCWVGEVELLEQADRDCTYQYTCSSCCGYGRPYLDAAGAPVEADTRATSDWASGSDRPDTGALTAEQRGAIGRYWLKNARAEHSSVAGFHRFALDLLAHGAPPALLARAQRAAAQELQHAIDCFTLASAFLGEPVGPAPMDMGGQAPVARTLAELAVWTARDGAIGETLAAFLAADALRQTTDPAVRRVLEAVVRDETEHAELAWATLRWALEVGGEEVRTALQGVFAGLRAPASASSDTGLGAWGVPTAEGEQAAAEVCVARVIRPVAAALLVAVEGEDARAARRLNSSESALNA